ncbi:AzlD domain-containing protein [Paenibacillus xylaniclasticus]|uniref:AzlD domain-containing protein n=1 Tax=Paenibacillus xylaniclasticus TaxID=588083 RepID=UPI000FD873F5|nr:MULTISPECIES: AzlD domain-containing protein [Paenibacillus]GFN32216.1 branched-chain amino acid ABC transporter [Paenibacillus curdlanolyticus]
MEIKWSILWIIVGSSIVTVLPRVLPLMLLSRLQLPDGVLRWLNHIPIAVMAALVGQELLMQDGELSSIQDNVELLAALPTFLMAVLTRSLLGTVVVGVISIMVLRLII